MSGENVLDADVGIVGAGPGGLAAATELAAAGVAVAVLDENARPGGQIFRQLPKGYEVAAHAEPPSHRRGHALLQTLPQLPMQLLQGATVWDAQPGRLWFEKDGTSWLLRCQRIVLACGAYDRCIPFPGWTLPGVITAGAAQVLARGFDVQPGRRALVAGSGPLLLPTVTALLQHGVEVVAALEASSRFAALRALPAVLGNAAKRAEALFYLRALQKARARLAWGHTVFAVEGDGRVQRAVIGKVDRHGRPRRDTARRIDVDLVCAGFGLVPSIELGQRLGCAVVHDEPRGGFVLQADHELRTSVPGVFAVGEVLGIGGGEVALAEGRLAAAVIRRELHGDAVAKDVARQRIRERAAADAMLRAFAPLPGLAELATEDTIVCRCEDVTRGAARAAARLHGDSARAVKMGCRAGMGPCQGRICGPSLSAMAGSDARPEPPSVQVPVKPVTVDTILQAPRG